MMRFGLFWLFDFLKMFKIFINIIHHTLKKYLADNEKKSIMFNHLFYNIQTKHTIRIIYTKSAFDRPTY